MQTNKLATIPISILIGLMISLFFPPFASGDMSGGNYEIYSDSFSVINSATSSGGNFSVYQSAGEYYATTTKSGTYELRGGFQAQEQGILKVNLSSNSLDLGDLSTSNVATDTITMDVYTDSETGYSVSVRKDGKLRDGSNNIGPVSDGSVTSGDEEYGITTSGNDGQLSQDKKITDGLVVASKGGTALSRSVDVIFKAAIDSNTPSGGYSQTIYFDTTVNP